MFVNPVYSGESKFSPKYEVPKDDKATIWKPPFQEYNKGFYENTWDKEFNEIPIMPYTPQERKNQMEFGL